jgi:carbon-monoxide dehydrogenase medium subunit
MSLPAFTFHRPATLGDAMTLGRRLGRDGAFLAGGTELLPDFHRGRESARHLIALDAIAELRGIRLEQGALRIGALATVAELARAPLAGEALPALVDAARALGSPQIRSLATVGGNFCRAVACADLPPVAVAAEATVRISGGDGDRELAAERFFVGPRATVLEPGEILTAIVIPLQPLGSAVSYQRFARRRGSALAVASVAARLTLEAGVMRGARIVLGAVAPIPWLVPRAAAVLEGEAPSPDLFVLAAAAAAEEARPITDLRGSVEFRRELVQVLTRRALEEAAARGGGAAR